MTAQIVETLGEKIFSNHHLIDNIYGWDLGRADLVNCMVLCREGMTAAARTLYREVPENLPVKSHNLGCSLVSVGMRNTRQVTKVVNGIDDYWL